MKTLKGEQLFLRALEPSDLDFLYNLENFEKLWEVSNTTTPFSKYILKKYLSNSHRDIYDVKQLRLVICKNEDESQVGFIDLFDFDPKHKRVGVGIVIFSEEDKRKGFALEALNLTCNYAFTHLNVHQIFAGITEDNQGSINLFEKAGFEKSGVKKDWIFSEGNFKNEYFYQLIPNS
ncbi:acetyltransferase, ribosomal protein N-acetylase [Aequorivita sublithincola DSM 14238]|uniref:Acetyltransferase, ribosomal protein N-acetylase n=1 Tax=Aequorivita sublithincola (strain DSM 14238 / LMG 21431 / ACAM 643 / 9-3) TaxID=746697 RepID=I3YXW3_AEQSU|nr:GNAT family protein [Aequorivita sublithincola]AFL81831.1 acetyltransferase, ribosomal protein N-acetylase [Aequorivita sublithincola DSM 14238]